MSSVYVFFFRKFGPGTPPPDVNFICLTEETVAIPYFSDEAVGIPEFTSETVDCCDC